MVVAVVVLLDWLVGAWFYLMFRCSVLSVCCRLVDFCCLGWFIVYISFSPLCRLLAMFSGLC